MPSNFIKVTEIGADTREITINKYHISSYYAYREIQTTIITLSNKRYFEVIETPQRIDQLLEESYK